MTQRDEFKAIRIVNEKGMTTMEINGFGRHGDDIVIEGKLMGAWPSEMYMNPEETWRMLGMLLKNFALVMYVICLPFIIMKRRIRKSRR